MPLSALLLCSETRLPPMSYPCNYLIFRHDVCVLLNNEQDQAVRHAGTNLLVVAGPGSGKTRVLTHKIAHLISSGTPPWRILAVAFTNKAATEVKERLVKMEIDSSKVWAGTFHSTCAKILRLDSEKAGVPKNFQILDADDQERVYITLIKEMNSDLESKEVKDLARQSRDAVSLAKNTGLHPSQASLPPGLRNVGSIYQDRLAKMGALDFDDLLVKTRDYLLSEDGANWRSRFDQVLVDEFQDTNAVQLELLSLLSQNALVTAVGDAAQGIYSWRGADNTVVNRFVDVFAPAHVIKLEENYRSSPEIVSVCQRVLEIDSSNKHAVSLRTSNPSGPPVELREFADDRDEAAHISAVIKSSTLSLSEHAVLVRTIAQTRVFEQSFVDNRIPYVVVGGLKFYDRAEIKDALAHLKAAVFPMDIASLSRAVAAPRRQIGPKTIETIEKQALLSGSVIEALKSSDLSKQPKIRMLCEHLEKVRDIAESSPSDALRYILDSGLRDYVSKMEDGQSRLENLDQLVSSASEVFAQDTGVSATVEFLERVSLYSSTDTDTSPSAVSLVTIHSAKGREFPSVFVPGLEEDFLPHVKSIGSQDQIDEESRLLYVAVSRAEHRLCLSHCSSRMLYGKVVPRHPSRFLEYIEDLPPEVLRKSRSARGNSWTSNHRSTPRGAGAWSSSVLSTKPNPPQNISRLSPEVPTGPRLDLATVKVGDKVSHSAFGPGVIKEINGRHVTVVFKDKTRILDQQHAPMSAL